MTDISFQGALAVWGAGLATVLAVIELGRQFSDRPRLTLEASIGVATNLGYVEYRDEKSWDQLRRLARAGGVWAICVRIVNRGRRPTTLSSFRLEVETGEAVEAPWLLHGSSTLPARLDENEGVVLLVDAQLLVQLEAQGLALGRLECHDLRGERASTQPPPGLEILKNELRVS